MDPKISKFRVKKRIKPLATITENNSRWKTFWDNWRDRWFIWLLIGFGIGFFSFPTFIQLIKLLFSN